MPPPAALSKLKLMSFLRCPRKLWLEQYSPELEDEEALDKAFGEADRVRAKLEDIAQGVGAARIPHQTGLRAAVAATAEHLAAGGVAPLVDATFDHEGLTIQVDLLERAQGRTRIVSVLPGAAIENHHLYDCAIQSWTLARAGCPADNVAVALLDAAAADSPTGLTEIDVTDAIRALGAEVPKMVAQVRATLAELDEPAHPTGAHCFAPAPCPFVAYCGASAAD